MKNITASIANTADYETIRLRLPGTNADLSGRGGIRRNWATGITLEAIYIGRRWFVVELYSIWQGRDGGCIGTTYTAYDLTATVDHSDILQICERLDIEPPATIPVIDA